MKRLALLFLLITGIAVTAQSKSPKISSPKPEHDFGEILEGVVISHSFEIINNGTADLKIDKVQASCGCTAVQPTKKILMPGEKTAVKVEFDSENRLGLQHKYVYVTTNDPQNQQFKLSFTANVVEKLSSTNGKNPKLVLLQNQFDYGTVEEGKIVETKISFKNSGNELLEIKDVKTSCGCTAAMLSSKTLKPGEAGSLRIELDTANRNGKLTRTVTLLSNDPDSPNQTITLFANIEPRKK